MFLSSMPVIMILVNASAVVSGGQDSWERRERVGSTGTVIFNFFWAQKNKKFRGLGLCALALLAG